MAVHRLPDPLTAAAFAGILTLLTITALTDHQPGYLGRAAIGAVALCWGWGIKQVLLSPSQLSLIILDRTVIPPRPFRHWQGKR